MKTNDFNRKGTDPFNPDVHCISLLHDRQLTSSRSSLAETASQLPSHFKTSHINREGTQPFDPKAYEWQDDQSAQKIDLSHFSNKSSFHDMNAESASIIARIIERVHTMLKVNAMFWSDR